MEILDAVQIIILSILAIIMGYMLGEKHKQKRSESFPVKHKYVKVQIADKGHIIKYRVYKNELVEMIADLTYDNQHFRKEEWCMEEAEMLIKAGQTIKSNLSA